MIRYSNFVAVLLVMVLLHGACLAEFKPVQSFQQAPVRVQPGTVDSVRVNVPAPSPMAGPVQVAQVRPTLTDAQRRLEEIRERVRKEKLGEAEQKAQTMQVEAQKQPEMFMQDPTVELTSTVQVGDITLDTYTRFEKFIIYAPRNGDSHLPFGVMWLGVQEAARASNGEEFAKAFREATNRAAQEGVLRKFHSRVDSYQDPKVLHDPTTVKCYQDPKVLPPGFPKELRHPQNNPEGYHIISHFGVNPQTRMGPKVNTFEDFVNQLPSVEKAIVERLPSRLTFEERAELAEIFLNIKRTRKIDGVTVQEGYTRNYPFRRWSTGSGHPFDWVLFLPDAEGMQEKGLKIFSRISGKSYWLNYECGLNLDELFGCDAMMVTPQVFVLTSQVKYPACEAIEITGKQASANGRFVMYPGERVSARVRGESVTPSDDTKVIEEWLWNFNNQPLESTDAKRQTQVTYEMVPENGFAELTVTSPSTSETSNPKICASQFERVPSPKVLCNALDVTVRGDQVHLKIPITGEQSLIGRIDIRLDGKPLLSQDIRQHNGGYTFAYSLVPQDDGKKHVVTAALFDKNGKLLMECVDETEHNTVPGRPIPCPAVGCRILGPSELVVKDRPGVYTFEPAAGTKWEKYEVSVEANGKTSSEVNPAKVIIDPRIYGTGKVTLRLNGTVITPEGKICEVSCERVIPIKKPGSKKGLWAALLIGAVVAALLLSRGKGGPSGKSGGSGPTPNPTGNGF